MGYHIVIVRRCLMGLQHLQGGRNEMFARHHNVALIDFVIEGMSVGGCIGKKEKRLIG